MNALDVGLRAVLVADTGAGGVNHATTGATGGIFQLNAPQKTVPTYVIFQEAADTPNYAFGNSNQADHIFYMIRVFAVDDPNATLGSGPFRAGAMADRLKTLLTNPSMTVTGHTLLSARFDRTYPPLSEWDGANNRYIYSRGILIEVWVV